MECMLIKKPMEEMLGCDVKEDDPPIIQVRGNY